MDRDDVKIAVVLFFILFIAFSVLSPIFSTMLSCEDNVIIDGDEVAEYNVINENEIEIVLDDGDKYTVLFYEHDDEPIDFTVNSDIYIELERFDTRGFWWEFIITPEPVYTDTWSVGRIIKVPSVNIKITYPNGEEVDE